MEDSSKYQTNYLNKICNIFIIRIDIMYSVYKTIAQNYENTMKSTIRTLTK